MYVIGCFEEKEKKDNGINKWRPILMPGLYPLYQYPLSLKTYNDDRGVFDFGNTYFFWHQTN